jgi:hypothetical protein
MQILNVAKTLTPAHNYLGPPSYKRNWTRDKASTIVKETFVAKYK